MKLEVNQRGAWRVALEFEAGGLRYAKKAAHWLRYTATTQVAIRTGSGARYVYAPERGRTEENAAWVCARGQTLEG